MRQVKQEMTDERIAWSIEEFAGQLGISRSAAYSELARGRLASSKIGKRRIVTKAQRDAYLALLEGGCARAAKPVLSAPVRPDADIAEARARSGYRAPRAGRRRVGYAT